MPKVATEPDQGPPKIGPSELTISLSPGKNGNHKVALLVGWAGSSDEDLRNYSAKYEEMGFATVRFTCPRFTLFHDAKKIPDYCKEVFDFMDDENLTGLPLIIHMWSNMGVQALLEFNVLTKEYFGQNSPAIQFVLNALIKFPCYNVENFVLKILEHWKRNDQ